VCDRAVSVSAGSLGEKDHVVDVIKNTLGRPSVGSAVPIAATELAGAIV